MRRQRDRADEEMDLVDLDAPPAAGLATPVAPPSSPPPPVDRPRRDAVVPWLGLAGALVVGGVLATPTPIPRSLVEATPPPSPATQVIWEATELAGVTSLAWADGTVVLWRAGWAEIDAAQVSQLLRTLDAVDTARTWECGPAPGAAAWTQCKTDDADGVRYVTIDPAVDLVEPAGRQASEP